MGWACGLNCWVKFGAGWWVAVASGEGCRLDSFLLFLPWGLRHALEWLLFRQCTSWVGGFLSMRNQGAEALCCCFVAWPSSRGMSCCFSLWTEELHHRLHDLIFTNFLEELTLLQNFFNLRWSFEYFVFVAGYRLWTVDINSFADSYYTNLFLYFVTVFSGRFRMCSEFRHFWIPNDVIYFLGIVLSIQVLALSSCMLHMPSNTSAFYSHILLWVVWSRRRTLLLDSPTQLRPRVLPRCLTTWVRPWHAVASLWLRIRAHVRFWDLLVFLGSLLATLCVVSASLWLALLLL